MRRKTLKAVNFNLSVQPHNLFGGENENQLSMWEHAPISRNHFIGELFDSYEK